MVPLRWTGGTTLKRPVACRDPVADRRRLPDWLAAYCVVLRGIACCGYDFCCYDDHYKLL
jgi:hypothetical protein